MDPIDRHKVADRLAALIAPVIAGEFADMAARRPSPPPRKPDRLMEAAKALADAVEGLDRVKFSAGEVSARRLLESRARALRAVVRARKGGRDE